MSEPAFSLAFIKHGFGQVSWVMRLGSARLESSDRFSGMDSAEQAARATIDAIRATLIDREHIDAAVRLLQVGLCSLEKRHECKHCSERLYIIKWLEGLRVDE